MSSGGFSCPHNTGIVCDLIKKECDPGDKGCVLYGKMVFSNPDSPSNAAVKRRERIRENKTKK